MKNEVIREHPCEPAKLYKNIAQAAELNGVSYMSMYRALKRGEAFVHYPYKFTLNNQ